MRNSALYQEIHAEGRRLGRLKGRRDVLLHLGRKKFGSASPTVEAALNLVEELEYLDKLMNRLTEVSSWDDLFSTPRDRRPYTLECSTVFQMFLKEGNADGEISVWHNLLEKMGHARFGVSSPDFGRTIFSILDLGRLRTLVDRLEVVSSWDELLATP